MPGAAAHPQPRVRKQKSTRANSPQVHRDHPAFPHANGFNGLWRALPGESGFLATVPAVMRQHHRPVDASVEASGPHAFAVRNQRRRLATSFTSTASPAQRFVTIAKRPSFRAGTARIPKDDLPDGEREKFLERGLDRVSECAGDLPVGQVWAKTTRTPPLVAPASFRFFSNSSTQRKVASCGWGRSKRGFRDDP